MTNLRLNARTGLAAIAAVLALPATSAIAQDAAQATTGPITLPADPVPSSSVGTPIASPAQTVVLPTVAPSVADPAPAPVKAAVTAKQASSKAPRADTARPTRAAPQPDVVAPVSAAPAPVADAVLPVEVAPVAEAQPAAVPAALVATERTDGTETLAEVLAGLLVAGLGAGALALLFRRRRRVMATEPVIVREPSPAIAEPEPAYLATPTFSTPSVSTPTVSTPTVSTDGGLPTAGAAIALPREAPTDFEERSSLLRRMIEARPDRANPFTSSKARAKRARLILASLGRKFERAKPRIDLSQYPYNWPALARNSRPAYA